MFNSILTIKFPDGTTVSENVTWEGGCFKGAEKITERVFFSDEFEKAWDSGYPQMTVEATEYTAKSSVYFEAEVGELLSKIDTSKIICAEKTISAPPTCLSFEEWWATAGIASEGQPEVFNLALKEIAQKSWEACQTFHMPQQLLAEYNRGYEEGREDEKEFLTEELV